MLLTPTDINDTQTQLVSCFIGGLRPQLQSFLAYSIQLPSPKLIAEPGTSNHSPNQFLGIHRHHGKLVNQPWNQTPPWRQ